jgi:hypothetical protein
VSNLLGGPGGTGPGDNRPLTDQEYQQVQRLLSDPLSFPLEFKAWLVAYLESSDLTLPMNAVLGLQKTLGITGAGEGTLGIFPAGLIFPYGGDTAPTGSYLCDGASYPRASEARLYTAIGTKYGSVDANSFNVPDIRGRYLVGIGTHADVSTLGNNEGAAIANRRPKHNHTVNPSAQVITGGSGPAGVGGGASLDPLVVGPAGVNPTDAGAYLVVNHIIVR